MKAVGMAQKLRLGMSNAHDRSCKQPRYPMTDSYLSATNLLGFKLSTIDDASAGLMDLILDTKRWGVRFLTAEADAWAPDRDVLIMPSSVAGVNEAERELELAMEAETLRSSPLVAPDEELGGLEDGWLPPAWQAQWRAEMDPEQAVDAPPAPVDETLAEITAELGAEPDLGADRWVRASRLRRIACETADGVSLRITDLLIDDADWELAYLELTLAPEHAQEDAHSTSRHLVPRRSIDWLNRDTETLHLAITEQELSEAVSPV